MRILEETKTRLKIQHTPIQSWLMGAATAGTTIILILGFLIFEPVFTKLKCDRFSPTSVSCRVQRVSLLGKQDWETINQAQIARTESRRSSSRRGSRTTYYVAIAGHSAEARFKVSRDRTATVSQIQAFLNDPNSSALKIQYSYFEDGIGLLLISLFGLGFGGRLLFMPMVTCSFYTRLQKVVIEKRTIWGLQEKEFPLEKIQCFEIEKCRAKRGYSYQLIFWTSWGERVALHSDRFGNRVDLETVRRSIEAFLRIHS